MFTLNMGSTDRLIRVIVGLALIAVGFYFISGTVGIVAGILGIILLVTGLIGWCPLYIPFKYSTRKS